MAAYTTFKIFLLTALLALTMPFLATSARPLNPNLIRLNLNLAARLNLNEESSNCWDSFCCEAIRAIEHQCWPVLLGTLGFTAEEADVLKGYCDEADYIKSPPSNPPSPPSSHDPTNTQNTKYSS
ncbi:hypothetical protein PRUPE_8G053400 [Prunus persica]|uniref:Prolamin-like domain-containing protein n=1 Tax=Prunus persica TaxID=3760 RepID=A0A251MWM3_PRUPE|nr:hypothetical protein PRUPE_8G053400 [Prunus persica]